jgi:hypothetical protein
LRHSCEASITGRATWEIAAMRHATALSVVLTLASAASAFAAPARLDDMQFIAANRCLGLMSSKSLGVSDAPALKQLLDSQISGRAAFIYDRADQARDAAMRQADHGRQADQAKLVAERDGPCRSLLGRATTAAQPAPPRGS